MNKLNNHNKELNLVENESMRNEKLIKKKWGNKIKIKL